MSNFILQLPLKTSISDEHALHKYFELSRKLYNAVLSECLKRLNLMRQSKEYRNIKKLPKKDQNKAYSNVQNKYKFTKNDMIKFVTPLRINEFNQIDSNTAQKLAQRAFSSVQKIQFGKAKRVYFKRKNEMDSVEGASNRQGIKFRDSQLQWNKLNIPVIIKKNDIYAQMALCNKIKYCRIVRKLIRGKYKFYVQLVLDGIPPKKINAETGEVKQPRNSGTVGIDIGTQTVAIASDKEVKLLELAPEVNNIESEKRVLQRKLDRQRRANNPHKYNDDGTIKQSNRDKWIFSNNYTKTKHQLAELQRKIADIRKQSHNKLANYVMSLGDDVKVEQMNYKGLQARAKETTVSEKTGKYNSKKRFGKSLMNKAPSMFLTILDNKLKYDDKELKKIDTYSVKASQYNHFTDEYNKKSLSDRWNEFECGKIQRDLYSAFLIMNVNDDLKTINKDWCFEKFDGFKELHDLEIERVKNSKSKLISSMGV